MESAPATMTKVMATSGGMRPKYGWKASACQKERITTNPNAANDKAAKAAT